jgi:hypothetical protein
LAGIGVVSFLVLLAFMYRFGVKHGEKGALIAEAKFNSLTAKYDSIADLPAKIVSDTVIIRPDPEIRWRTRYLDPVIETAEPYLFADSLVNEQVAFYVLDSVEGRVFWRDIGYELFVPLEVQITDSVFTKVPVRVDVEVPTYMDGWWIGGKLGGGSQFAYTVDVSYSKGRHQFGVEYLRFGPTNNWLVGYKYLIFRK